MAAQLLSDAEMGLDTAPAQPSAQTPGGLLSDAEMGLDAPGGPRTPAPAPAPQLGPAPYSRRQFAEAVPDIAWDISEGAARAVPTVTTAPGVVRRDPPSLGERFRENFAEGARHTLRGVRGTERRLGLPQRERAQALAQVAELSEAAGLDRAPNVEELLAIEQRRAEARGDPDFMVDPQVREAAMRAFSDELDLAGIRAQQQALEDEARALHAEHAPDEVAAREGYQDLPGFHEESGLLDRTLHGGSALLGQLLGSATSPESFVPVGRAQTVSGTFGRGFGAGAGVGAAVDPAIQRTEMTLGLRDEYSLTDTAINAVLGGLVSGAFNVTPAMTRRVRERLMRRRNVSGDAPTSDTRVTVEDILGEAIEEGLPLDPEVLARLTGTDRPEAMPNRTPEEQQARREVERELGAALEQPDVLRRQDVIGEDPETGELQLREGAMPARDPRGRHAHPGTLGELSEAQRLADELGLTLSEENLQLAARDIAQGVDARQAVRSYADEPRADVFTQTRWRRFQRDDDTATPERTRSADYQPGAQHTQDEATRGVMLLDARRDTQGRLAAGEQVESTGEFRAGPDGRAQEIVRRADGREEAVDPRRLSVVSQPEAPRQRQDRMARSPSLRPGVGTEGPTPQRVTDRISGRQAAERPEPQAEVIAGEGATPQGPGGPGGPQGPRDPRLGREADTPPQTPREAPPVTPREAPPVTPREAPQAPPAREAPPVTPREAPEPEPVAREAPPVTPREAPEPEPVAREAPQTPREEPQTAPTREAPQAPPAREAPPVTPRAAPEPEAPAAAADTVDPRTGAPVERIDAEMSVPQRSTEARLADPDVLQTMRDMAEGARWTQTGGQTVRTADPTRATGERVSRTRWETNDPRLMRIVAGTDYANPRQLRALINTAARGGRLGNNQRALVDALAEEADGRVFENLRADTEADPFAGPGRGSDDRVPDDEPRAQVDRQADAVEPTGDNATGSQQPNRVQQANRAERVSNANPARTQQPEQAADTAQTRGNAPDQAQDQQRVNGALEDSVKAGQFGVLNAGVPVDEALRMLGRMTARAFGGKPGDWRRYWQQQQVLVDQLREAADRGPRSGKRRNPLARGSLLRQFGQAFVGSVDGELRLLADRYDTPTLRKLADVFHASAGRSEGVARTYSERHSERLNVRATEVQRLGDFLTEHGLRGHATQIEIRRLVENPKLPRRGAKGEAADRIERFFKEELDYQRAAGVEIGDAGAYFSRHVDRSRITRNKASEDQFVRQATKAYREMGHRTEDARILAADLMDRIVNGDTEMKPGQRRGGAGGIPAKATEPRRLSDLAAKHLEDFYDPDIPRVLSRYVNGSIKRAEIARSEVTLQDGTRLRFGDRWANWPQLTQALQREGVPAEEIARIQGLVSTAAGVENTNAGAKTMQFSTTVRTWGAMALLDRVALSAVPELYTGALRGTEGNVLRDLGTLSRAITQDAAAVIRKSLNLVGIDARDRKLEQANALAEDLGLIAGDAISYIMQARFMGDDVSGAIQQKVQTGFFKNVLLTQLNDYSRVKALRFGHTFMRRQVLDQLGTRGRRRNRSAFFLRELGIPKGRERAFADWFQRHGFDDHLPSMAELTAMRGRDAELAELFRTATHRFVDQSIMRPDASTRPKWASTPYGAVVFSLLNFTWAFQRNVINRWGRIAANNEVGTLDKLALLPGLAAVSATIYAASYAANAVRDELGTVGATREQTPRSEGFLRERALSYTGFTGKLDPLMQMVGGLRYQRSPAEMAAGPVLGTGLSALEGISRAAFENTENTNTAERRAAGEFHRMLLQPSMQAGLALMPRVGLAAPAVSALAIGGARATRDTFTDALAGPEDPALARRRQSQPLAGVLERQLFGTDEAASTRQTAGRTTGGRAEAGRESAGR